MRLGEAARVGILAFPGCFGVPGPVASHRLVGCPANPGGLDKHRTDRHSLAYELALGGLERFGRETHKRNEAQIGWTAEQRRRIGWGIGPSALVLLNVSCRHPGEPIATEDDAARNVHQSNLAMQPLGPHPLSLSLSCPNLLKLCRFGATFGGQMSKRRSELGCRSLVSSV